MGMVAQDRRSSRPADIAPEDEPRAGFPGDRFEDYDSPLFFAWQINSACNLGCLHCCEEAGHSLPDEMTADQALSVCRQIVEMKIPYVAISGGEPLLCPHLFDVCEAIRGNNISLKIETNGEFIDERVARRLADLKLRSVQISLDGATAEAHERLRLAGNWEKAVAACKNLLRHDVNTEIVFVPTQFNIHEVGALIDLAYSIGVYGVYTGKTMRIGRAARNWDIICPSEQQYGEFFEVLQERAARYEGKMKVYYYPYDVVEELKYRLQCPAASLLVVPNGNAKLIGPLPFVCGNLKVQSLHQVWDNYKKAWRDPRVIEFTEQVIADPRLLAKSNDWIGI